MVDTNDTIDGLLAEFRGYSHGMPPSYHVTMSWADFRKMLDRFDAAWKRAHEALEFIAHYNDDEEQMDDPYCSDGHILAYKAKEALGIKEKEGGANG